ncbi:NAD(P)/FAD-dependent oxidoreductase [Aureibacillus halotolerans]|uniref:Thioredoxin reductase n=1 Tax=Aureibacillus halotolerans TaxID=1508390 RepID=A0A4R6U3U9_9BACI|nr:NAD(P)/FAD-dependent oxidoreductase [Aureibacillus halotolerans]TDQ40356.1 thioredoxin reductase [Aureibacillus halotolerans]
MAYDCAIIGGGPAGLNAALVLGRARKRIALFDDSSPRNAVTHASHGFITRDGVTPEEFRRIGYEEVLRYPTVEHLPVKVTEVYRDKESKDIVLRKSSGEKVNARKLILAGGLKEELPNIKGVHQFYGKSLFNCPFCDGWELRDQPLVIVSDQPHVFHTAKLLLNWSKDVTVCTHGADVLTAEQQQLLSSRGIQIVKTPVEAFIGREGKLEYVQLIDGTKIARTGGFIAPTMVPQVQFEDMLGYEMNEQGGIVTDGWGRTSAPGVYAAGDATYVMPAQLVLAAASGSKAAMGVVADCLEEEWPTI